MWSCSMARTILARAGNVAGRGAGGQGRSIPLGLPCVRALGPPLEDDAHAAGAST